MEKTTALTAEETICLIEKEFEWRWDDKCENMCGETDCFFLEEIGDIIYEISEDKSTAQEAIEKLLKLCPEGRYHDCYPWSNGCDAIYCEIAFDLWTMIQTGKSPE